MRRSSRRTPAAAAAAPALHSSPKPQLAPLDTAADGGPRPLDSDDAPPSAAPPLSTSYPDPPRPQPPPPLPPPPPVKHISAALVAAARLSSTFGLPPPIVYDEFTMPFRPLDRICDLPAVVFNSIRTEDGHLESSPITYRVEVRPDVWALIVAHVQRQGRGGGGGGAGRSNNGSGSEDGASGGGALGRTSRTSADSDDNDAALEQKLAAHFRTTTTCECMLWSGDAQPAEFSDDVPHRTPRPPLELVVFRVDLARRAVAFGIKRGFPLSSSWSGAKFRCAFVFHVPGVVPDAPLTLPGSTTTAAAEGGGAQAQLQAYDGGGGGSGSGAPLWDAVVIFTESFRVMAKMASEGLKLKQQHYPRYEQADVRRVKDLQLIIAAARPVRAALESVDGLIQPAVLRPHPTVIARVLGSEEVARDASPAHGWGWALPSVVGAAPLIARSNLGPPGTPLPPTEHRSFSATAAAVESGEIGGGIGAAAAAGEGGGGGGPPALSTAAKPRRGGKRARRRSGSGSIDASSDEAAAGFAAPPQPQAAAPARPPVAAGQPLTKRPRLVSSAASAAGKRRPLPSALRHGGDTLFYGEGRRGVGGSGSGGAEEYELFRPSRDGSDAAVAEGDGSSEDGGGSYATEEDARALQPRPLFDAGGGVLVREQSIPGLDLPLLQLAQLQQRQQSVEPMMSAAAAAAAAEQLYHPATATADGGDGGGATGYGGLGLPLGAMLEHAAVPLPPPPPPPPPPPSLEAQAGTGATDDYTASQQHMARAQAAALAGSGVYQLPAVGGAGAYRTQTLSIGSQPATAAAPAAALLQAFFTPPAASALLHQVSSPAGLGGLPAHGGGSGAGGSGYNRDGMEEDNGNSGGGSPPAPQQMAVPLLPMPAAAGNGFNGGLPPEGGGNIDGSGPTAFPFDYGGGGGGLMAAPTQAVSASQLE